MARIKCPPGPSITKADVSSLSTPATQDPWKEEEANEDSGQSDLELSPLPVTSKKPKAAAKRKPRKSAPAKSIPSSPVIASSSTTTPQPEQGPKRKGGNKRKWTHEYCLTCTRYGRACGGRREGEEGCAVCRDPDRSKGEKLRECLWADHEAGVTDYKTAREIFKQAQAEARAQRAKPKRQQSNNAAVSSTTPRSSGPALGSSSLAAAYGLPKTTTPLDLQPPTLVRSSLLTQQPSYPSLNDDDTIIVDRSQFAVHPAVANAPNDYLPRIHRPQLTYVAIDSDNEERISMPAQNSQPGVTSRTHQGSRARKSHTVLGSYFDADLHTWVNPIPLPTPTSNSDRFYTHPYRSAYDAPPAPPPHLVQEENKSRQLNPPRRGSFSAREPGIPSSRSIDKSASTPRKWSQGSKVANLFGHSWKTKGWKPSDNPEGGKLMNTTGRTDNRAALATSVSVSDMSSLSSYMSIDGDTIDGIAASDINQSTNNLKRKFNDTITDSADPIQGSTRTNTSVLTNNAALHINLNNPITNAPASSRTQHAKNLITFHQPIGFTFPGEITIQEDEEACTSGSDSELTSDEGKLKSLPSKLRKLLSRSRITKVIIGDDIFEIRPKMGVSSSKVHKLLPSAGEMIRAGFRGKGRQQVRARKDRVPVVDRVDEDQDETDEYSEDDEDQSHDASRSTQATNREEDTKIIRPPIKIKLIFKPKLTVDPRELSVSTSTSGTTGKEAIEASTVSDDTEMDDT